jgi:hypothetical protein
MVSSGIYHDEILPSQAMTELLQLVAQLERVAKPKPEMDSETFESWQESARRFYEELEDEDAED